MRATPDIEHGFTGLQLPENGPRSMTEMMGYLNDMLKAMMTAHDNNSEVRPEYFNSEYANAFWAKTDDEGEKSFYLFDGERDVLLWTVSPEGVISFNVTLPPEYTLPPATAETLGGIKPGDGMKVDPEGALSPDLGDGLTMVNQKITSTAGAYSTREVKTTSGTWVAPKTGKIKVTLIGGGGAGGAGGTPSLGGLGGSAGGNTAFNGKIATGGAGGGGGGVVAGGGGGGGGDVTVWYIDVIAGNSYPVQIGAGGTGGTGSSGSANGGNGAGTRGGLGGLSCIGGASGPGGSPGTTAVMNRSAGGGGSGALGFMGFGHGGGGGGGGVFYSSVGLGGTAPVGAYNGANGVGQAGGNGGNGGPGAVIIEY